MNIHDRYEENAFFLVMNSSDIWSIIKPFMYPNKNSNFISNPKYVVCKE